MKNRVLASVALIAVVASSQAWNDEGHRTIAAIAWSRMTPQAQAEAKRLLGASTFLDASVWADQIRNERRETGPWHYKDTFFRIDGKRTVHKADEENAVWAIRRFSGVLGDKSKSDADRLEALRFVSHFVGDIHQPLHATAFESDLHPEGDRGGNDYKVETSAFFPGDARPPTNLHYLWDMGAGLFAGRPSTADRDTVANKLAAVLVAALPPTLLRHVGDQDPDHWAAESFNEAKKVTYKTPEGKPVSPEYMESSRRSAAVRVTLAGYRLADLLNRLLSKTP